MSEIETLNPPLSNSVFIPSNLVISTILNGES